MDNQRDKRLEEIRQRQEHRTGVSYWECQSEIKFLLEEIKLLHLQSNAVIEHNARLLADACQLREEVSQLREKRDRLQVERDKAIEVLRWYGGHRFDDGEKARKIIKEISHDPLD